MIENIVFLELVGLDVIFELNQLSTYSRVKKE
jgi:hypothetical protein